jgi:hypothetical protein
MELSKGKSAITGKLKAKSLASQLLPRVRIKIENINQDRGLRYQLLQIG